MPKHTYELTISGDFLVTVQADSDEEALKLAREIPVEEYDWATWCQDELDKGAFYNRDGEEYGGEEDDEDG